jgi:hypothetical protein
VTPPDEAEEDFYNSGNLDEAPENRPRYGDNSGDDDLEGLGLKDLLTEMQVELFKDLLRNIKAGIATPQEKATAAKILKDNGLIFFDGPNNDPSTGGPRPPKDPALLPSFEKPEYER